jgi:hypothetical protein
MAKQPPEGFWNVSDSTDPENISAIINHLLQYTDAPTEAISTLQRALAERDAALADAKRRLSQDDIVSEPGTPFKRVDMKPTHRKAYTRDVALVERSYVCRHCGQTITLMAYPSAALPSVCSSSQCQADEQQRIRQASAERQKRYRERHKARKDEHQAQE